MIARTGSGHVLVVVAGFCLLFGWVYAAPLIEGSFLAESDIYEQFLPQFLAPITTWSNYEFGGMPAFADPQDTAFYPLHFVFARILGSWNGFIVAAYVLASCFTYAYVYSLTRSRVSAAFAGLAFGLSEAMMERIAHVTTIHAVAWLPAMLIVIDRLRAGARVSLWIAAGAAAIGCCLLGGHPQIVVYMMYVCALYALAGGIVERAGWSYYARLAAAAGLGLMLAAVKFVPLAETVAFTARQTMNFAAFVSHSNTPAQMLTMLLPGIIHEGREAPTYVGLATLVFALVALLRVGHSWRTAFWLSIVLIALLIGVGDATPVARLAYEVPFYDKFRVVGRHLIFATFGMVALAGLGLAAMRRGDVPRRSLGVAIALVCLAVAAGVVVLAVWPDGFVLDAAPVLDWNFPVWTRAVWLQLAVAGATAAACIAVGRRQHSAGPATFLLIVIAADLLLALPYGIGATGVDATRIPGDALRPSVHAVKLGAGLMPLHQRLLAPAGTQLDAVVPAAFARVWQIPIAGGYGPMLLARHSALAMMGTNGSVEPLVFANDNAALDLLGVKYIVIKASDLDPSSTITRDGITWASRPIDLAVGPAECGQRHPRRVSYALPPGTEVASIALAARLRCSEDVPQGTEVAQLHLRSAAGEVYDRTLTAGIDIAEAGLADPHLRNRAKHTPARLYDPQADAFSYVIQAQLPAPFRSDQITFDVNTPGWLEINRLTVVDSEGRSMPIELPGFLLESSRWKETARFETSRVTDRVMDEDDPREEPYVVLENRRALPRAWMASEVIPLAEKEMLTAVHHSQLPDGRRFDPSRVALVDPGTVPATKYPEGPSTVAVRAINDGAFTLDVTSAGGGFLVLSESFYPGWRARIGDRILPVHAADVSLQGVVVPPGTHALVIELVSRTLRLGAAVSGLGVMALLFLLWHTTRR